MCQWFSPFFHTMLIGWLDAVSCRRQHIRTRTSSFHILYWCIDESRLWVRAFKAIRVIKSRAWSANVSFKPSWAVIAYLQDRQHHPDQAPPSGLSSRRRQHYIHLQYWKQSLIGDVVIPSLHIINGESMTYFTLTVSTTSTAFSVRNTHQYSGVTGGGVSIIHNYPL